MLDHGAGRIGNLGVKISGLAFAKSKQLPGFFEKYFDRPTNLIDLNHANERQGGIVNDQATRFTIRTTPCSSMILRYLTAKATRSFAIDYECCF